MPDKSLFERYLLALRKTPLDDKTEHTDRAALEALLQALDDVLLHSLDFLIGQGSIIGLVLQAERKAAGPSPQLWPLVFAHHRDLPQRVTAQLADNLHDLPARDLAANYDRKVPPDPRKTR